MSVEELRAQKDASQEIVADEEGGNGPSDKVPTFTIDEAVDKVGYGRFQIHLTLLAGLGWLTDACEIFILSIIGHFMACDWTLYVWENAVLTSVVFFGIMIGAPVFGKIADVYGRKICLGISAILLFLFGALSATSPSFVWMAIFRTCMGFALGGIAQSITLCMEFYPSYLRGKAGFYLMYFWSVGSILVVLISWLVMYYLNSWRTLLLIMAMPGLIVVISLKWYPESARYYLVSGKYDKATKVLMNLSKKNNVDLPEGKLVVLKSEIKRGRLRDLFTKKFRRTTLLFWYIWFGNAFFYYGIVLITPIIIKQGSLNSNNTEDVAKQTNMGHMSNTKEIANCVEYTMTDYINLLWTTAAEFPGLVIYTYLVEHVSRKRLLSVSSFLCAIIILLLNIEKYYTLNLFILFVIRAIITAMFQLVFIMTSETYPTPIRALGMGTGSAWARVGGLIVPYVCQVLIIQSPPVALGVMAVVIFLSGIATILIPFEMRGQVLSDSITDDEDEKEENKDEEKVSDIVNSEDNNENDKDKLPNPTNSDSNSSAVEVVSKT